MSVTMEPLEEKEFNVDFISDLVIVENCTAYPV